MNEREWDKFQLQDYVNNFSEHQRDNVLKQIIESELLEQVLLTSHGKVLLNSIVDDITNGVGNLVAISLSADKDKSDKIENIARNIAVSYKAMEKWATMLAQGDSHKKEIKKVKK